MSLLALQVAAVEQQSIEQVHAQPASFHGQLIRLCGEVTSGRNVLFSDAHQRVHGRVGIRLQGYGERGGGKCVTGRLFRVDGKLPSEVKEILIADAAVHPDYVFSADRR